MVRIRLLLFPILSIAILGSLCGTACADPRDTGAVLIEVRTIEASSPLETSMSIAPQVDPRLADLALKLQKLHYRNFRLLGLQREVVPLMQKGVVTLMNGHTLAMRPQYLAPSRIGLWLRWTDGAGMEILDTRLHFDPGESMLTGMDSEGEKGIVLAIDVRQVR